MSTDFQIKRDLTNAYKILAKLGMDDHTYTHLSARPIGADYYYIYPFGLRFSEVTEDNLLKVDLNGNVLEGSEKQYNKTGYIIHGSIYRAKTNISVVFHLHTISTVAVSAMKKGLLPISQWALHFYDRLAYHDYNALALDNDVHGDQLVSDLADKKVMFLRNHGFIACGQTIHEAMFYCYHLEMACKTQIAALSTRTELIIPPHLICEKARDDILTFEENLGLRDWEAWLRWIPQE